MDTKYTDRQMALILKRAAEQQAVGDEPAHSLESIQQIAQQVGIDPRVVADVAANLDSAGGGSSFFGAPSAYRASRRVPRTAGPIDHAAVLATIRDHLPFAGEAREVGDGIEWHAGPGDNKTVVAISPAADGVVLRIDVRQQGPKVGAYLAAGTVGFLASLVSLGLWSGPGLGVGLGVLGVSFAGARALWNRHAENRQRRLQRLSDALAEQLKGSEPPPD
jgi:hypothetical protein